VCASTHHCAYQKTAAVKSETPAVTTARRGEVGELAPL
jgi:hypothetical protein